MQGLQARNFVATQYLAFVVGVVHAVFHLRCLHRSQISGIFFNRSDARRTVINRFATLGSGNPSVEVSRAFAQLHYASATLKSAIGTPSAAAAKPQSHFRPNAHIVVHVVVSGKHTHHIALLEHRGKQARVDALAETLFGVAESVGQAHHVVGLHERDVEECHRRHRLAAVLGSETVAFAAIPIDLVEVYPIVVAENGVGSIVVRVDKINHILHLVGAIGGVQCYGHIAVAVHMVAFDAHIHWAIGE